MKPCPDAIQPLREMWPACALVAVNAPRGGSAVATLDVQCDFDALNTPFGRLSLNVIASTSPTVPGPADHDTSIGAQP